MKEKTKYGRERITKLQDLERGGWKKKWKDMLPVALIFPNSYHVGMANLGFQIVYELLNRDPGIVCERFFLPEGQAEPRSIESNRPLGDFKVVFVSISFEQDYPFFLKILAGGGIALRSSTRRSDEGVEPQPLVVCGGVATMINPEPIAPFVDFFVIGDAEPVLPGIVLMLKEMLHSAGRADILRTVAARWRCCYVPQFYDVFYHDGGTIKAIRSESGCAGRVKKVFVGTSGIAGHSSVVTPACELSDLFLIELGRGCSRGCRFCAAGFVYRPPRKWQPEAILASLAERPESIDRIGLLGMEMLEPKELRSVGEYLLQEGCSLSFSSLRADILDGPIRRILAKSGLKTAAIAPDGSSERLRRVINKGLSADEIVKGAEVLADVGITNIKLYFMVGLPSEEESDWEEAIDLVGRVRAAVLSVCRARGKMAKLTLSINPFVPKPWTPFQFHPFASMEFLRKALGYFKTTLARMGNVSILSEQPDKTLFQAVLARGDRRVADGLEEMVSGSSWRRAFGKTQVDPYFYAGRQRGKDEIFPWEVLDHGISKEFLWQEYQRALQGKTTHPCIPKTCRRCGVCSQGEDGE